MDLIFSKLLALILMLTQNFDALPKIEFKLSRLTPVFCDLKEVRFLCSCFTNYYFYLNIFSKIQSVCSLGWGGIYGFELTLFHQKFLEAIQYSKFTKYLLTKICSNTCSDAASC